MRSYCFCQPGASPGGGVGIVGSGDGVTGVALPDGNGVTGVALPDGDGVTGVALPDGDALSPGDAAAAGASDDVADGTSDGAANPLSAGDAATVTDGDSDGAGSLDWFDLAQPADANTKISATMEATRRSVRIGPPARSRSPTTSVVRRRIRASSPSGPVARCCAARPSSARTR